MSRFIRQFLTLYLFVLLLLLLAVSFSITFYTTTPLSDALLASVTHRMPLIIYVAVFTLVISFIFYTVIGFFQRQRIKRMEKSMADLLDGRYSSKRLNKMANSNKIQVSSKLDFYTAELSRKLITMSKEVLMAKEEQTQVSKETREEIVEAERRRIARELHDSVSQQLFASSMILSAINEQVAATDPDNRLAPQLVNVEKIVNESQSEMRALLLHLRPVKLNDKKLKEGIEQLLEELQTKIKKSIKYDIEDIALPMSTEDNLFRIVQELLSNVLRHSKADELEVYLKKVNERVHLRVIDDGVGFDMNKEHSGSYGLPNIKERIAGLGGNVKIISFPNQGTSVDISVPVDLEEKHDKNNID